MQKTFLGPDCLRFEDGVVWLWLLLENLYTQLTILSCYDSTSLTLVSIGRDDGLSTLFFIDGIDYKQMVLKIFPGPNTHIYLF